MLDRKSILNKDDRKIKTISIPEWDGDCGIKVMSGKHRDLIEAELRKPNPTNLRARIAAYSVCDPETGELLFTEADIPALADKSYSALDRIVLASSSLNELTQEALDDLKKSLAMTTSSDSQAS